MSSILERNKKLVKTVAKTREEYAEDALYREVWEDVNNEKTQQFIKKYWRHIACAVVGIMIIVCGINLGVRMHVSSKIATAQMYESAVELFDAKALANLADNSKGATADLALFQSYVIDKDVAKLDKLAKEASSRDFSDLAKIHLATIRGDKMNEKEFEEYLSDMNTKKSPFFYIAKLLIAEKYLSVSNKEKANVFLDEIINDKEAPANVLSTAQMLK